MASSRDWAVIREGLQKPVWFCVASGPSLTKADCGLIPREAGVIAVNNSWEMVPWADVLYACDYKWWEKYQPDFRGVRLSYYQRSYAAQVPSEDGDGLGRERMRTGNNSGYQAVNIAYLLGARLIVLLGYDMQETGGRKHWHPDHKGLANGANFHGWRKNFSRLAVDLKQEGVRVINATRETALNCFERMPIDEAIQCFVASGTGNPRCLSSAQGGA